MKRIILIFLLIVLVGCSSNSSQNDMTYGEFRLEGEVYKMGEEASSFMDADWKIHDSYTGLEIDGDKYWERTLKVVEILKKDNKEVIADFDEEGITSFVNAKVIMILVGDGQGAEIEIPYGVSLGSNIGDALEKFSEYTIVEEQEKAENVWYISAEDSDCVYILFASDTIDNKGTINAISIKLEAEQ